MHPTTKGLILSVLMHFTIIYSFLEVEFSVLNYVEFYSPFILINKNLDKIYIYIYLYILNINFYIQ